MVALQSRLPRSIQVMRHRDFALVQIGNGVSQLGTWGQYVALGWAIRQLSGWPFAVSLSLVAQFLPFLLLAPLGGALADRKSRRRLVVVGNVLAVPPSIALGVLVATGEQTIALLLTLAAMGGIVTALTQPAMSAVVGEIVPTDELPEAVASMSIVNNLTRILGPSMAALVISGWGLQWAFYLNAASFFAVVIAWAFVRTTPRAHETHEPVRRQLLLGLRFARADRQIGFLLLVTFVTTFVVYHAALMPVIVTDLLHGGTSAYALLQTMTGVGAIAGAIVEMVWIGHPKWVSATVYLTIGWVAAVAFPQLWETLGPGGALLLVTGGILYTAGAVVYATQRPDPNPAIFGYHEVFHAFVIAAAVVHFSVIAFWALPKA